MRLAIVGSQGKSWTAGQPNTARVVIGAALMFLEPELVISGGCPEGGVDIWAEEECNLRGWTDRFWEIKPKVNNWMGVGGFKDRNMMIAEECTHLLAIRSVASKTYGSGWTADYAEKLGRIVWRITL